jgi:PAS domain S-box-containing protein
MADSPLGDRFFAKAADKFIYRLTVYAFIVLMVGLAALIIDIIVEHDLKFAKEAAIDGLATSLAVMVGLCLFEFLMYGATGRLSKFKAEARRADAILTTVAQAIPDLVYIKDAEGRHLMVNKAVEEFTGHTNEELHGKTMADLMPPALAAVCIESDREPIRRGRPIRTEERFDTPDGVQVLDTIKAPLRDDRGEIIGIVGVSRNITEKIKAEEERRQLQTRLLQAQKMESLGHLSGGIAHDFNNILTVVVGYASILKAKRPNDEVVAQQADQILRASRQAQMIVKGLFAFSSKQKIEKKPLDLNSVLSEGRKLLLQQINNRVSMTLRCCDEPLTVIADQVQLERVLMNLASNARDAMPEGGELVFSTDHFDMGADFIKEHGYGAPGAYAHLAVSDTGIGISEEHRKKIFEPFFTTKDTGKGTGFGLAIVYGIIKQHSGFINVASEPGRGTTFDVFLPLAKDMPPNEAFMS